MQDESKTGADKATDHSILDMIRSEIANDREREAESKRESLRLVVCATEQHGARVAAAVDVVARRLLLPGPLRRWRVAPASKRASVAHKGRACTGAGCGS